MSNTINIPVQLRPLTGGREHIKIEVKNQVPGTDDKHATLGRLIDFLEIEAPGIKSRLLDQDGKLRKFVNIFIDGQDCRTLMDEQAKGDQCQVPEVAILAEPKDTNPLDLRLTGYEEVTILPAIAGG